MSGQRDTDQDQLSGGTAGVTSSRSVASTSAALNAADTVTLTPSQDATISASAPNQNFGTATTLDYSRTLVQFDLASLSSTVGPTDYITSARLEMTLTNDLQRLTGRIRTVTANRLTSAWTEAGATWNCAIDANPNNPAQDCDGATRWSMTSAPNPWVEPASTSVVVQPAQIGVVAFDLTPDVRGLVSGAFTNNGWLLKSAPATGLAAFASRQTATPPRLVVTIRRCSAALCDDNNACTVDSCSPIGVCVNANAANGTSCSDGNACSQSDVCQAGVCVGRDFVTCTASDSCHRAGVCNPGTGQCSNPVVVNGTTCSDGNACTAGDACIAGVCTPARNVANGTGCSDGSSCTSADSCQAGVCVGHNPVTCAAGDQCHAAGVCNPSTGQCGNPNAPNGTACNDGNASTANDVCTNGACAGSSLCAGVTCASADACHPSSCNPSTGQCQVATACTLYGVGTLPGTGTDGLGVSPALLEDGANNNQLSAFGSAITYTGSGNLYVATPDRGPNNGLDSYTDRYYLLSISLSGGVVTPQLVGAATLNKAPGVTFTGLSSQFDASNSPASRRLDPEGVRVSPLGTFYVSDEYGPFLYEFSSNGDRIRALSVPSKFLISTPSATDELPPVNASGRQLNRGMEGLAITPDGSRLYGIMQNALIQDGALNASNGRVGLNNRILEIDTSSGTTRELLYPIDDKSYGVNELVAVNDHQFIAIERDGNAGTAAAFKRLYLIDSSGATDVSGIAALPTTGTPAGVTPVAKTPFLDLLASEYGLAGASFPEKIEGLAFGPDLPDGRHVLIVTNDNDGIPTQNNNVYVFAIGASALPGYVPQQATFDNLCAGVTCAAPDACHLAGICNPGTGTCSYASAPAGTSVASQAPGDCKRTQCDGNGNMVAINDDSDLPDDDGLECTSEVCSNGASSHPPKPLGTACSQGGGSECDGAGSCVGCVVASQCPGADTECAQRTCTAGTCGFLFNAAGTPTSSQAPGDCRANTCDGSGNIVSTPDNDDLPLDDGNACTQDVCIAGAPAFPVAADGTACNDSNACSQSDVCDAGICIGFDPVVCAASDQCHSAGTCDPMSGACSNPVATDGTACNDGNPCTQSDACQVGACSGGSPVVCMASDACHVAGACDSGTGLCSNPIAPNGTPCSDGNACTQSDQCNAGACVAGAPVTCTPVDGCHPASCNPSTGTCSATSACALYGVGGIPGSARDGLDLTPGLLENDPPTPNNQLGAFGSAITYTGVGDLYLATPDRGPADGATSYTDRYYLFSLSLSGGVVTPTLLGAATLNQGPGVTFVGTATAFDATNSPASRRLDPEGVRVSPSGTFYVSDEYGPFLYEFGSSGNRVRTYTIPSKFLIATPGSNELPPNNTSGRQTNRGMEGLAITPDGSKLYGIMQNALIQDGALNGSNSRIGLNNRILEVDTVTGDTREFLYQLSNAAYGVNELLAINDHQFLAIERDGNAGTGAAFKRLMLVDITGATDISGIASLPTSGTPAGVTPVTKTPFLDLLSSEFGLAGASFPEKIEGLAFGPDRPDGKHVLVVTNDNDFNNVASNFYVFTVDPSALPGYVAQQATFTSACASVSCGAPAQCYDQGTCNPATATCSQPPSVEGTACGTGQTCDGAGHCNTCVSANDCPGTDGECGGRTCASGVCGMSFAPVGTACGTSQVCDGAGNCSAHIVITEVESNNDPVGDWIELYNADASSVDISGYLLADNSSARLTVPAGTIVAAGGYVAFVTDGTSGGLPNAFGLGGADSARLFSPTGVLLDSYTWAAHASTTYGRCPTVTSGFVTTGYPTKGAANGCSMPNIRINEVESNGDPVGDWIELTNLGTTAVNIGGFLLADDSTARLTIPAGTILPAGGYVAFVTDGVSGGLPNAFGLGSADQARFFHPDTTTLIDSTSWSSHATNTWGRCPNGTGAFAARVTSTRGLANVCP